MGPAQISRYQLRSRNPGPHYRSRTRAAVDFSPSSTSTWTDIDAYIAKAESLGGKLVVPRVDIPNYGSFAWISDLDGNTVGLWKPAQA